MDASTLTGHTGRVSFLAVTPDGALLASGSLDDTVRLWRLPDGAPHATLKGHTDSVYCLAVTPDGALLASGSHDNTVRLWRLPDGAPHATLEGHTGQASCLAVTPDGALLASGGAVGTVRLWEGTLDAWCRAPVGSALLHEVEAALATTASDDERSWLELIVGLGRWRRRFEVEVGDAVVHAGEFDIELAG